MWTESLIPKIIQDNTGEKSQPFINSAKGLVGVDLEIMDVSGKLCLYLRGSQDSSGTMNMPLAPSTMPRVIRTSRNLSPSPRALWCETLSMHDFCTWGIVNIQLFRPPVYFRHKNLPPPGVLSIQDSSASGESSLLCPFHPCGIVNIRLFLPDSLKPPIVHVY